MDGIVQFRIIECKYHYRSEKNICCLLNTVQTAKTRPCAQLLYALKQQQKKNGSGGASHTQKVWETSLLAILCEYVRVWCNSCFLVWDITNESVLWCTQNLYSIWAVNSVFIFSGMSILIHHAIPSTCVVRVCTSRRECSCVVVSCGRRPAGESIERAKPSKSVTFSIIWWWARETSVQWT